jgi:hypothetical protein
MASGSRLVFGRWLFDFGPAGALVAGPGLGARYLLARSAHYILHTFHLSNYRRCYLSSRTL